MLLGQFEGKISEKYQVGVPKKFREHFGETLIVTKGFESCLLIVSVSHWETLLEGTEGKPFTNKATRELQRFLLGNASQVALDAKGRFVVPEYLRVFANLEDDVVFVGLKRYGELWNKKQWDEHQKALGKTIEGIAEKLEKSGE